MWLDPKSYVKPRGKSYVFGEFIEANYKQVEEGKTPGLFLCGGWHEVHKVVCLHFALSGCVVGYQSVVGVCDGFRVWSHRFIVFIIAKH